MEEPSIEWTNPKDEYDHPRDTLTYGGEKLAEIPYVGNEDGSDPQWEVWLANDLPDREALNGVTVRRHEYSAMKDAVMQWARQDAVPVIDGRGGPDPERHARLRKVVERPDKERKR